MTFLNILQWSLASMFFVLGVIKLSRQREAIATSSSGRWALDFSTAAIRAIGLTELLAAIGLIAGFLLPYPRLAAVACLILVGLMSGAVFTHLRRSERALALFAGSVGAAALGLAVMRWTQSG